MFLVAPGQREEAQSLRVDAAGAWVDGFRVRPIEYGFVNRTAEIVAAIGTDNIGVDKPWTPSGNELSWSDLVGGQWPIRFPQEIAGKWKPYGDLLYFRILNAAPSDEPQKIIARLVDPRRDHRDRCLFLCDHATSSIHLAALR